MHGRRPYTLLLQRAGDLIHVALRIGENDGLQRLALLRDLIEQPAEALELGAIVHLLEVLLDVGGRVAHLDTAREAGSQRREGYYLYYFSRYDCYTTY